MCAALKEKASSVLLTQNYTSIAALISCELALAGQSGKETGRFKAECSSEIPLLRDKKEERKINKK